MLAVRLLSLWGIVIPHLFLLWGVLLFLFAYPELGLLYFVVVYFLIASALITAVAYSVDWIRTYRRWKRIHP
jgi:hypothetical protein